MPPTIYHAIGFDSTTTILQRFTSLFSGGNGTYAISSSYGRNSTSGIRFSHSGSYAFQARAFLGIPNLATIKTGFAINFGVVTGGSLVDSVFLSLWDNTTCQVFFTRGVTSGHIKFYRGNPDNSSNTLLGETTYSIPLGQWIYFEADVTINNTTGSVKTYVNGVNNSSQLNLTGLNTRTTSNDYATSISYEFSCYQAGGNGPGLVYLYMDDLIVANTLLGDVRVREELPNATGTYDNGVITGASNSYLAVDDPTVPDDNTTYSALQNVNDKFTLNYPTLSSANEIIAVTSLPYASKSDAGTAEFAPVMLIGGTVYTGLTVSPSNGSYAYFPEFITTSPATGVTWTVTEVNSMEFGVKRTA